MTKVLTEIEKASVQRTELTKIERIKRYLSQRYEFRNDVVGNEIQYRTKGSKDPFEALNDSNLVVELYESGFSQFRDILGELLKSNFVPRYDPIQFYFENLPTWDETQPDYIAELTKFVQAKDPNWFKLMFRKMLVRVIACATGKSAFNKQCFVFVGKQNDGKTSFLRFLCPPSLQAYYKDNIDFESKDGKIALGENLFINLDELATLNKTDINKAKSFFTETKIKVRRPYDKKDSIAPRRASFVGSTNNAEFLTDETGNVRWLIFEVDGFQHDHGGPNGYAARVDINRVWAQAYALLKAGFPYDLSKDEIQLSETLNRRHMKQTVEMEVVGQFVQPSTEGAEGAEFLNASELIMRLQGICGNALKLNRENVGKALTSLNFVKVQKKLPGMVIPSRGYYVKVCLPSQNL